MGKAAQTRKHILEEAFNMVYQNGYQATSVDKIIEQTQVTKGAFYYHFKNKDEMGIAIIREVILPRLSQGLLEPMKYSDNPINGIYSAIEAKILNDEPYYVENGCPTNNLVQEMSAVNSKFYQTLRQVLDTWIQTIQQSLELGQQQGQVRTDIDARDVAEFIVSGYEGIKGIGKIYGKKVYRSYLAQLQVYLRTLRE
ncbi:MAG: TetR/AcrR family transcriptional regulator [Bacteroidota bacterium]